MESFCSHGLRKGANTFSEMLQTLNNIEDSSGLSHVHAGVPSSAMFDLGVHGLVAAIARCPLGRCHDLVSECTRTSPTIAKSIGIND